MRSKNSWVLLLMVLSGIVLGGFIGGAASGVPFLSWLNFGQSFGLSDPLVSEHGDPGHYLWLKHPDHHGQHHWRDHRHPDVSFHLTPGEVRYLESRKGQVYQNE